MSAVDKILVALFLAALIAASIVYAKISAELGRKAEDIARLEIALSECGRRVKDAGNAIERQNAAIDATRVDTVYVSQKIKEAEKKYAEVREVVIQSVGKDSGCENKVENIDFALRRFYGELRADGR